MSHPRGLRYRSLIHLALPILAVLAPWSAAAAAPPELRCESKSIEFVGKLGKRLLLCEAQAAGAETSAAACRSERTEKAARRFEKRHSRDCGDASGLLVDQVLGAVDGLVARLRPALETGRCIERKLATAADYWHSRFLAQKECLSQSGARCSAVLARIDEGLLERFAKLEGRLLCPTTGDAGAARSHVAGEAGALTSCILGTVSCEGAEGDLPPSGGTVTTDEEGDGANPLDPVETTVESPVGGTVQIQELAPSGAELPGNYSLLGVAISITAPDATAADPLRIEFVLDASVLPPATPIGAIELFRNGVAVPACNDSSGVAAPDPCVLARILLPDGDLLIVALTSQASDWAAGASSAQGGVECTIDIVRTDSASDGAVQLSVNYAQARANSDASIDGAGSVVGCTTQIQSVLAAYYDDETSQSLRMALVSLSGMSTPATLARCEVQASAAPVASDFIVTAVDAAPVDTLEAGGGVCGAPTTGQSPPFSRDGYYALRAAVGLDSDCRPCECDVNASGFISASDSLRIVRAAAARDASQLICPETCSTSVTRSPDPGSAAAVVQVACQTVTTTTTSTTTSTTVTTTTLPPVLDCTIEISRTDAATDGALQIAVDYSGAGAAPDGTGAMVECANELPGSISAFFDDEAGQSLRLGFVSLDGAATPDVVASCTVQATQVPAPGDFTVTVIDTAPTNLSELGGGVCGAPSSGHSPPYARDGLMTLRAAVGVETCDECECDVNNSGFVSATDSLLALRAAVAENAAALVCPSACGMSMMRSPQPGAATAAVTSVNCGGTTTTTMPGPLTCTIDIERTDTANDGALQFAVDYSAAGATPNGEGATASCQSQISGGLFARFDDEAAQSLRIGLVSLDGMGTPATVARCTVEASAVPEADDFVITVIDTAPTELAEAGGGACGAPSSGHSPPYARDGLVILRTAVGVADCDTCECDVNNSGAITASDSLVSLRAAASQSTAALTCPSVCGTSMMRAPQPGAAALRVTGIDCTP